MNIHGLELSRLRNNEHFQFGTDVSTMLLTLPEAVTVKLKEQIDAFAVTMAEEDAALNRIMKSVLTARINAADKMRDTVFRGLFDAVKSAKNHFDKDIRTIAMSVGNTVDAYENVSRMSHPEATSALGNLLKDLQAKHSEDIAALGLERWINELKKLNSAVEEMLISRYVETSERPTVAMQDVRRRTDRAYRNITVCLEAMSMMETAENIAAIETMIASLNSAIARYGNSIAIRRGQAAAKKEDDDIPKEDDITEEEVEEQP